MINRLVPYKRIDLAIEAFNHLDLPLLIVGEGRARAALQAMAKDNVRFLGRLDDADVCAYLANCRALIFPGYEDFGIAPVEAQAVGRPVVAYSAGGALETVSDGITGVLFHDQSAEALAAAVRRLDDMHFDPHTIRGNAERFDNQVFIRQFGDLIRDRCAASSCLTDDL
jgi:glycosyltransferase involved in cell wall biosynthesis